MATQFTSVLKLALPTQGELSGSWGNVVNDNITSMIEQAIAGLAVINTWSSNSHTLTSANGTTSESRCAMLSLVAASGAPSAAASVICPAAAKTYIVKNASGQAATLKTASGSGIAIPNGKTMLLFCDGTNVIEAVNHVVTMSAGTLTITGLTTFASMKGADSTTVTGILDEDNMASNSATKLVTQQSVKAYVDSQVGTVDTLAEVLANGNTSGGTDIVASTDDKVQFRDSAIYINSSADGQLDIVADTEIQIAATTIDINGAINASGEIIAASLDISGNVDIDGTTNLDVVDIDGAVDMATTALVTGVLTTTAAAVFNGGFASNADSTLGTDKKVQFRDSAIYINSSADGQLDIVADTEIQIAATTIDINGAINASGEIIAGSLDISGDIDVDGTTNLDIVDIDGAVNMAGTAVVIGVLSTTAATVFNGGFASNADSTMDTNKKIQFRDAAIHVSSSTDGQLDIVADTEIQIAATTIDINGAINASGEIIAGSLDISGAIDVDGTSNLDVVDIDGAVDMASTLIVAGNINAVAGGINLGATGSANLLDDYEEGTWTPTLAGADTAGTYTVVTGTSAGYTKVGRLVHVGAKITLSAATGGSGVSILGGLPFNYASGSLPAGFISVSAVNLATANPASISLEPTSSGAAATLVFRESKDNAAVASTPIGGFSTSSVIHINMTYRV